MKPAKAHAPAKAPAPAKIVPPQSGLLRNPLSGYSWSRVIEFKTPNIPVPKLPDFFKPTFNPTRQSTVSGDVSVFGKPNNQCGYTQFSYGKDTGLVSTFAWKTGANRVSFDMYASGELPKNNKYLNGVFYGTTTNAIGKNTKKILYIDYANGLVVPDSAACYIELLKNQTKITYYQQVKIN